MASTPVSKGQRRVGGRFWALADDDADDDEQLPAESSPTPSDLVCESILVGYSEEQVASHINGLVPHTDRAWNGLGNNDEDKVEVLRRVVHRQTSDTAVRPWKGPLPKVRLPTITLADFIDNWKRAPIRRKPGRPAVRSTIPTAAPAVQDRGIRVARHERLNRLLDHDGSGNDMVGLVTTGYKAQVDTARVQLELTADEHRSNLVSIDSKTVSYSKQKVTVNQSTQPYSWTSDRGRPVPGFPSPVGKALRIPALVHMAVPRHAETAVTGALAAATASTRSGGDKSVQAPTDNAAGSREGIRVPAPGDQRDYQGRGNAMAGRGGAGGSGHNRGGGGYQGYIPYPNHWNDFAANSGGGRPNWNTGGGEPGGGANQWHRPFQPPKGNFVEGVRGANYRQ